jgi:hypothetical protein
VVGNVLECLRPDFHRVVLGWADKYGGIVRVKFLWRDALVVTDPAALAVIMGRGEGALDKAAGVYSPINYMCDPHGQPNLLTSAADGQWKAIRKAVAVSFSIQNIKKKYPLVLGKVNQLLGRLAAQGSCTAVDVDQAALRVTLDVIGLVSGGIWGAGGGGLVAESEWHPMWRQQQRTECLGSPACCGCSCCAGNLCRARRHRLLHMQQPAAAAGAGECSCLDSSSNCAHNKYLHAVCGCIKRHSSSCCAAVTGKGPSPAGPSPAAY